MDFQPGEIVNVTIRGVRYVGADQGIGYGIETPDGSGYSLPWSAVLERVAPKEWPPQTGDIWVDSRGREWFSPKCDDGPELNSADDGRTLTADYVLDAHGPLTLARRRDWTPDQPAETDTRAERELDRRARLVADLRAAAAWIERHTELPVTSWRDIGDRAMSYCASSVDDLARVAAQIGAEVTTDEHGHMHATATIDGIGYRAFHVPAAADE